MSVDLLQVGGRVELTDAPAAATPSGRRAPSPLRHRPAGLEHVEYIANESDETQSCDAGTSANL